MKRTILAAVLLSMAAGIFSAGCGAGNTQENAAETEGNTAVETVAAEDGTDGCSMQDETDAGGYAQTGDGTDNAEGNIPAQGVSPEQHRIAEEVYSRLKSGDYDSVFADMIYPGNSVIKADDLNNYFVFGLTENEMLGKTEKKMSNERFEDGCIKFDYGIENGNGTTVYIFEDAATPDGYEVRINGFSGGPYGDALSDHAQETTLILPSGLTNVVVDGVNMDAYKNEEYYSSAGGASLDFDTDDYTAYRVVFPTMTYNYNITQSLADQMESETGYRLGRYRFLITADSAYGRLEGEVMEHGSHFADLGIGDREGAVYFSEEPAEVNEKLEVILQKIFDRASSGDFDIGSYKEFFAEGTEDEVIQEQLDELKEDFASGGMHDIRVENVHTYTEEEINDSDGDLTHDTYIGAGRAYICTGVHISYNEDGFGTQKHRDCYQALRAEIVYRDGEVRFVSFLGDDDELAFLTNWLDGMPF